MNLNEPETRRIGSRLVNSERLSRAEFYYRALVFVGIVAAVGLLLLLLWQSTQVILLIFAGLLVAVFLRGIAERISRHTPLSENWALGLLLLLLVGAIALGIWLMMPSLQNQYGEISEQLPQAVELLRQKLAQYPAGRWLLEQIPNQPVVSRQSKLQSFRAHHRIFLFVFRLCRQRRHYFDGRRLFRF